MTLLTPVKMNFALTIKKGQSSTSSLVGTQQYNRYVVMNPRVSYSQSWYNISSQLGNNVFKCSIHKKLSIKFQPGYFFYAENVFKQPFLTTLTDLSVIQSNQMENVTYQLFPPKDIVFTRINSRSGVPKDVEILLNSPISISPLPTVSTICMVSRISQPLTTDDLTFNQINNWQSNQTLIVPAYSTQYFYIIAKNDRVVPPTFIGSNVEIKNLFTPLNMPQKQNIISSPIFEITQTMNMVDILYDSSTSITNDSPLNILCLYNYNTGSFLQSIQGKNIRSDNESIYKFVIPDSYKGEKYKARIMLYVVSNTVIDYNTIFINLSDTLDSSLVNISDGWYADNSSWNYISKLISDTFNILAENKFILKITKNENNGLVTFSSTNTDPNLEYSLTFSKKDGFRPGNGVIFGFSEETEEILFDSFLISPFTADLTWGRRFSLIIINLASFGGAGYVNEPNSLIYLTNKARWGDENEVEDIFFSKEFPYGLNLTTLNIYVTDGDGYNIALNDDIYLQFQIQPYK